MIFTGMSENRGLIAKKFISVQVLNKNSLDNLHMTAKKTKIKENNFIFYRWELLATEWSKRCKNFIFKQIFNYLILKIAWLDKSNDALNSGEVFSWNGDSVSKLIQH